MKIPIKKITYLRKQALKITLGLAVVTHSYYVSAKITPIIPPGRQIAFNRAKSLDNGISISWLEQTWNKNVLNIGGINQADLQLLKQLGFKSIRLPIAFKYFEDQKIPLSDVLECVDKVFKLCRKNGFKLIIDYHYGNLNDENYTGATKTVIATWTAIATKYRGAAEDNLFFELYNEPPPINPQIWKDAIYNIVISIRSIDPKRTFIVGASNYNSIYELSRFVRLQDENIIYAFHFYEPFLFTHQGADWVGSQVATTGVAFPYNEQHFPPVNAKAKGTAGQDNYNKYHLDGNEGSVYDKLLIAKAWGDKYAVPIICGEYGSYNKYADEQSRCRYTKAVRTTLKQLHIPGILWDYNGNFSLFKGEPNLANLSDCMRDAIGYTGK